MLADAKRSVTLFNRVVPTAKLALFDYPFEPKAMGTEQRNGITLQRIASTRRKF